MKVAMIGLGKLGYPVARAMALMDHQVYGHDHDPEKCKHHRYEEEGLPRTEPDDVFGRFQIRPTVEDAVEDAEIIFVAVQTPHKGPEYEGTIPMPALPAPFSLQYLHEAVDQVKHAVTGRSKVPTMAVISTVLPGNIRDSLSHHWPGPLVYNPSFIAMGSVIRDFLRPEFVLVGTRTGAPDATMFNFYANLIPCDRVRFMTWEEAELTKLCYNTMIGMKICFANTVAQLCHHTPHTDCDVVMETLAGATDRLISGRYLNGGMGDGGGCHPRDQIALDFYATRCGLGANIFKDLMIHRQVHAHRIAQICRYWANEMQIPIGILGHSFKPGIEDRTGSHAMMVKWILENSLMHPVKELEVGLPLEGELEPGVILVGCDQPEYHGVTFNVPTVLIDPFGSFWNHHQVQNGEVLYRPIGRRTVEQKAHDGVERLPEREVRCEL